MDTHETNLYGSDLPGPRSGSIEVICGSMFSGKTEELMRRLKRATIARLRVAVFKPSADTRYSETDVVSHDQNSIRSIPITHSGNIALLAGEADVIGIDEAQFLDDGLVEVCQALADQGVRVIVSGLDMDFLRRPFGPLPHLMSVADYVTKVHAVCIDCGRSARYSYRLGTSKQVVMLGAMSEYAPLCRTCYQKRIAERKEERSNNEDI